MKFEEELNNRIKIRECHLLFNSYKYDFCGTTFLKCFD
jgi:hypothetical protein